MHRFNHHDQKLGALRLYESGDRTADRPPFGQVGGQIGVLAYGFTVPEGNEHDFRKRLGWASGEFREGGCDRGGGRLLTYLLHLYLLYYYWLGRLDKLKIE